MAANELDQINTLPVVAAPTSSSLNARVPRPVHHHTHPHHHSVPYYILDTSTTESGNCHNIHGRVTETFAQGSPCHHRYPARIAEVKDDLTFRPPLRKKPKLSSNATETTSLPTAAPSPGMRRLVGISKTTSVPSFNSPSLHANPDNDKDRRPSSSSGISPSSANPPLLRRTNSNTLQRSASQRRPPASHSSYGIETTLGPPPSYSTQRTLSQDRVRLDRTSSSRAADSPSREGSPTKNKRDTSPSKSRRDQSPSKPDGPASDADPNPAQLSIVNLEATPSSTGSSADEVSTQEVSSPETADTESVLTPTSDVNKGHPIAEAKSMHEKENEEPVLLRPAASEEDSKGSSSDEKKSEDLFLNIAKTDASRSAGQTQAKLEKRRSRVSLPFFTSTRPSTGYKSSPIQERFDTASVSGRSEALSYYNKRASLGQHVPSTFSRTYTQDSTIRAGGLDTQSSHPADMPRRTLPRRYSNANSTTNTVAEPVRTFSRPSTARTNRMVSDGGAFLDRPRMPEPNPTESTISTTAPSTVWDELDDLKSRIKKLELTGKLPPSSAAAMSSAERPKTATTAATTMSSSPKPKPAAAPQLTSAIEGIPSNIHPTLHEALGNAKAVLNHEVYQKLQATAQDALQLSMMMSPEGYSAGASTVGTSSISERQIRRRTESMCRSLTELAIAILADNKQPPQPVTRPGSRDAYQPISGLRSRRYSNDTNDRPPVTSRVQSRLEIRRTSAQLGSALNSQPTPPEDKYQTPPTALPPMPTSSSSRIGRTTSLVRSRRTPGYNADGATDDEESSPSVRPVSRAMTEVSTYRQAAKDRAAYSREYTAQHPMPQHPMPSTAETNSATRSQLPAHISTHLIPRRKYGNLSSNTSNVGTPQERTPVTPKEPWGRITIVPAFASSPVDVTPESQNQSGPRPSSTRRSLGFTSRISSVSSRLRAAKGERNASGVRDTPDLRGPPSRDIASSGQGQMLDNHAPLERHGSGQSFES
ncbi:hypothetical protein H2200_007412 [Cladophialophora chaetospira]|uniref:LPXTG-motif cell wall anchor domain protein n=1 Tax=Cladophialophora chaetospira TaxID=386627 RepID=A0AA38X7V9_9EURO|nr:hypothetical protein H2200_007412 [Cladophialophora chaetospira]